MPIIVHGEKSEVSGWSGELSNIRCSTCDTLLEVVRIGRFKTLYGSKMHNKGNTLALQCINPSCENIFTSNASRVFSAIPLFSLFKDEDRPKFMKERTNVYNFAHAAVDFRHNISEIRFSKLDQNINEFNFGYPVTKNQLVREFISIFFGGTFMVSFLFAIILFVILLLDSIFDFLSFSTYVFLETDLIGNPISYLAIAIIFFTFTIISLISMIKDDSYNIIAADPERMAFHTIQYAKNNFSIPKVILSDDMQTLKLISINGDLTIMFERESFKLSDDEYYKYISSLMNNGYIYEYNEKINTKPDKYREVITSKLENDEFFKIVYNERMKFLFKKSKGMSTVTKR